ncbi:hypothetical protein ABZ027_17375 [Streptomyces sp. NPDC006332]|uniref:hypothetical protein n=1 Tax=Streptomyces sp. NPDC006332 TaxID=3155456 RepID=UPI0033A15660
MRQLAPLFGVSPARRIIKDRVPRRWGPARIAHRLRLVPSIEHLVPVRYGLVRLASPDRATGRVVRRYQRPANPFLRPADHRQGRTVQPDTAERVGRRPPLPLGAGKDARPSPPDCTPTTTITTADAPR